MTTLLQILPALHSGGVERGTIEIAIAQKMAGYTPIVASAGGRMVPLLESHGIRHITLPLKSKNPLTIIRNITRLSKVIKTHDIALIHARSRAPAWSGYFAAKRHNIPFITTFHGTYNISGPVKRYYNSIMTKGMHIIAISHFIENHIKQNYPKTTAPIHYIPRGVDLEAFNPKMITTEKLMALKAQYALPDDRKLIVLPGRITRWKGQLFLLKALDQLPKDQYCCLLVGDAKSSGQYLAELTQFIHNHQLEDNVKFTGNIQDMPALYRLADIVISASLEPEAFGRVAIEAQAMGAMLIATNHGGSLETVIDKKTGWLVPPNDVEALTEQLKQLLNINATLRNAITQHAIQHINCNFSIKQMCTKTLAVYQQALKERTRH